VAIFHLSVKPVSRKGGRSATAAAAYRAGEKIHDLTSDQIFDYTRKRGVEHSEIVLPTSAAKQDINWARDRQALWNAAEMAENRSNSRVAREYEIALPHELNHAQRVELVRAFSADIANRYGVGVDFSIHAPHWNGDERNHHAHILTTTRTIEADGLGKKTEIEWSDTNRRKAGLVAGDKEITGIRKHWEELTNEYLKSQGIEARIDHRSLEAQGIDREPQSHLGPAVSGMQRRGMETQVGERLERESLARAQERLERAAELGRLERERGQLERSIFDLSGDVKAARQERQAKSSAAELLPRTRQPTMEEIQAKGRRQGLQERERQAKDNAPSLEDIRRQGREDWLKLRAETAMPAQVPRREVAVEKATTAELSATPEPDAAAVQRERLSRLTSAELQELIRRINPPAVSQLVALEPAVKATRAQVENTQHTAHQALLRANQAAAESNAWRHAHGMQAKLHDLGVAKSAYLAEREAAARDAERVHREVSAAIGPALAESTQAWAEASQRLTQATAPAREQVAELRQFLAVAYERERLVTEFEQLAKGRAAGRREYQDTSKEWQALAPKLRRAIDRYNGEHPQVQAALLEKFSRTPVLEKSLGAELKQHREDLDQGLSL
jgi:hypothetical protein